MNRNATSARGLRISVQHCGQSRYRFIDERRNGVPSSLRTLTTANNADNNVLV